MSDSNVNIVITANNRQFLRSFSHSEARIKAFGGKIGGIMRRSGETISRFSDKITGLSTLIGGIGAGMAFRKVIDLDTRMARLAIQAGLTKKQMYELKTELFEIGDATLQTPESLLTGIEQIVTKTGDLELALQATRRATGYVASATGADVMSVGSTVADLNEKLGITGDRMMNVFDILAQQGKEGAFELKDMAAYFPEILSAARGFGIYGEEGLRKLGAFLQIARRGTGTAAETTTAVVRTFANIIDKWKVIKKETGFVIFDKEKSDKEGRMVLREMDVILKEIVKRTGGDITKLQQIFGIESIKAMRAFTQAFQEFGDFREFDRFVKMGGDGKTIMKDFAFWSEQTAAKLTRLSVQGSRFANQNLAGPIEALNKALEAMNNNPAITSGTIWALLGMLGLGFGTKAAKRLIGLGIPGWVAALTAGGYAHEMLRAQNTLGPMAAEIGAWKRSGVNVSSAPIAEAINDQFGFFTYTAQKAKNRPRAVINDPDATRRYIDSLVERADSAEIYRKNIPDVKNDINLNIYIDRDGRTFTETDGMNTTVRAGLRRGRFME